MAEPANRPAFPEGKGKAENHCTGGISGMKKKTVYLIASILLVLAFFALLAMLTWGRTLRVAKANRLLAQAEDPGGLAAKRIYEDSG